MGKKAQPKTVSSCYMVVGNTITYGYYNTLSLARKAVRNISITSGISEVQIIRQNVTETIVDTIKPDSGEVCTADSLDFTF
jgi:hypothetical protein